MLGLSGGLVGKLQGSDGRFAQQPSAGDRAASGEGGQDGSSTRVVRTPEAADFPRRCETTVAGPVVRLLQCPGGAVRLPAGQERSARRAASDVLLPVLPGRDRAASGCRACHPGSLAPRRDAGRAHAAAPSCADRRAARVGASLKRANVDIQIAHVGRALTARLARRKAAPYSALNVSALPGAVKLTVRFPTLPATVYIPRSWRKSRPLARGASSPARVITADSTLNVM